MAKKEKATDAQKLRITLVKSTISSSLKQKRTIEALGLKKIRQNVVHTDNPCLQGMLFVVKHLVKVEPV